MVAVAGKVVVVTGGRRGLGAALVDELLARGVRKIDHGPLFVHR